VNLVTDGPPATALGFTKSDPSAMMRQPRRSDEAIMNRWMFIRYIITGLYVGFATIGSFLWWYRDKHVSLHQLSSWTSCEDWLDFTHSAEAPTLPLSPCDIFYAGKHKARAQTMALSTLVVMEMLKALSAVSLTQSMVKIPPWTSPVLLAGVAIPFLLHLAVIYIPQLALIFGLAPLTKLEWKVVAKFAVPILLVEETLKYVTRHKDGIEESMKRGRPRFLPAPHF
jgi:Ca2+-transporting ATPase